jgi:cytochrome b561
MFVACPQDMSMPRPHDDDGDRYDRVAAALHWLIAIALLAQIAFGFLLDDLAPRGTPSRAAVINLHKSFGIVLGLSIVLRLAWRLGRRPPRWPAAMAAWQQRAARIGHGALYVCMVVMPASGYVASNFSSHGVRFFGQPVAPWGPDLAGVYDALAGLHGVMAWVFTALIAGHVLAALQHAWVDRDATFRRIWPWRTLSAAAAAARPVGRNPS